MSTKVPFKERLIKALELRNMTKKDLCEKSGVTKGTISKYCSDQLVPKMQTVEKLAEVLDVNSIWLMGYNVQVEQSNESVLYLDKINNKIKTLSENEREKIYNMIMIMYPNNKNTQI